MKRKIFAVVLAGSMVLGSSPCAFAADSAAESTAEAADDLKGQELTAEEDGSSDELDKSLSDLLGSIPGSSDDESGNGEGGLGGFLGGILESLGSDEGGFGGFLGGIFESLGSEEGGLGDMVNGFLASLESEEGGLGDMVNDFLASLESEEGGLGGVVNGIFDSLGLKENGFNEAVDGILGALKSEESSVGDVLGGILGPLESEESSLTDVVNEILGSFTSKDFSLDDLFGGLTEEDGEETESLAGSIFDEDAMDRGLADESEPEIEAADADESEPEVEAADADESEPEIEAADADEAESGDSFNLTKEDLEELADAFVSGLDLDLSGDELAGFVDLLSDPGELKDTVAGLFEKDAPGAEFLDSLGEQKEELASLIDSLKDEDGEYSLQEIAKALKSAEEAEDGKGIIIGGEEISGEELSEYVEEFLNGLNFAEEDASFLV